MFVGINGKVASVGNSRTSDTTQGLDIWNQRNPAISYNPNHRPVNSACYPSRIRTFGGSS